MTALGGVEDAKRRIDEQRQGDGVAALAASRTRVARARQRGTHLPGAADAGAWQHQDDEHLCTRTPGGFRLRSTSSKHDAREGSKELWSRSAESQLEQLHAVVEALGKIRAHR
jgi:hypothetical protein